MNGIVRSLKSDHDLLLAFLLDQQPSMAIMMESTLSKVLVLACASEIEADLQGIVIEYFQEVLPASSIALEFVRNKAISRQYHTYFDWDAANANKFFSLFGTSFKSDVSALVRADPELADAIRSFLELGLLRNNLVHQSYAAFTLEKTADEIFGLYEKARDFLSTLTQLLRSVGSTTEEP